MARNAMIRLCYNNMIRTLDSSRVTYSSQLSAFPYSNAVNDIRSKVYKFGGRFKITASNKVIYINDGSNKSINLTEADYTTPALLAAHIATQLNASSSGWSCSFSTTTFLFTISRTSSATLRLSQTTNSLWSTIGFTTALDLTGTSFIADQQRNHTSEEIVWDLGSSVPITFFAMVGLINQTFNISSTATIKLYANAINDWTTPPLDRTLTRSDLGVFHFLDDLTVNSYRWWKLEVIDYLNTVGPNLSISNIFLGDYIDFTDRTVGHGYSKTKVDPSTASASEGGTIYYDSKPKYFTYDGLKLDILKRSHKDAIERMFNYVGKSIPFYCSIDPLLTYTDSIDELTRFVQYSSEPVFSHTFRDMFSTSLNMREVV